MYLTKENKNSILYQLSRYHNLEYRNEVSIQEKGWHLILEWEDGEITMKLLDCISNQVNIPKRFKEEISDIIISKIQWS